ncbi:ROK family transcriptional regulator [Cellulomonas sp. APG4]|uniref:ROK family transcriptional regulator n=1 Tax=Cellulomonas sp. APG4 TaxID=1538656 RepID=UPI001ED8D109|nr:ROK family transcriptional regulator [Cellulomonas sp. APG4]
MRPEEPERRDARGAPTPGGAPRRRRVNNREVVLEEIRARAPISRVELSGIVGLTPAAITSIARRLIAEGLVTESGHSESTGGKRRVLLEINAASRYALGAQLTADSATIVVEGLGGAVVGRSRFRHGVDGPAASTTRVAQAAAELLSSLGLRPESIVGFGVAVPGGLDASRDVVLDSRVLPEWAGFRLRNALEDAARVPVRLYNDGAAAAAGEAWGGAAGKDSRLLLIQMDRGIGGGIVLDGAPLGGRLGRPGEIGHVVVDPAGQLCRCGGRGCLEAVAAPAAVEQSYAALAGRRLAMNRVAALALRNDPAALAAVQASADAMSQAVLGAANLLDLDHVILAGSGFGSAVSIYIETIQRRLDTAFLGRHAHPVAVRESLTMRDAAAVGAAEMVLKEQVSQQASSL